MFEFEIPDEVPMEFWSEAAERAARLRAGLPVEYPHTDAIARWFEEQRKEANVAARAGA
jgi:hypothetical protein